MAVSGPVLHSKSIVVDADSSPSVVMVRHVRANYRGRVPQRVARTSGAMTVGLNEDWHYVVCAARRAYPGGYR